ncbi:BAG family molecular chaperone regulator 6 [Vigna unguiculata]|uniref:BAG family molecular chaperone regulator 6 n=1 Tax=Vigna unguiculata TaxID=3917 RepID=UPI001016D11C|nr:BAG family molecular chaperone regulator 6 [Vigna unguiculata]
MIPIRSMDSYPYQRNQMPLPHHYHPGIEALPPQMKFDPSKPHLSYDPRWPYAGNYGRPMPPHFCCGHNNFPCNYGYMPSYPHAPSPMYYSGGCPAYTDPYFVPYSPQPPQTMELPRYEYDKYMPRDHHCCGCPNHSCNQKEGRSVKIEEHEPDVGRKVNDSLVPIQLKNYPYPFVWIPQEHTSNKQMNNPDTMEVGEQNKPSRIENANAVAQPAQEPRVWNGWLPFDVKGVPSMIHDGNGIRNQKQDSGNNRGESENGEMGQKRQSEPKRSEFPFPIFWLPYYNKLEESGETNNQENNNSSPKIVEEVPHAVKSVPVKSHVDEGGMNGTRSDQAARTDTNASDVAEKVTNARSIPVKQIGKDVSLDQMEENVTKKDSSADDKKRQSASLPKASKLPPVCLRVDPLPRKKNGNGSSRSRSLSPPSSKGKSQVTSGESLKTPVSGTSEKTQPNLNHQNAPKIIEKVEPKEKTIQEEFECKTNENKGVDKTEECQSELNVNIPSEGSKGTRDTFTDGDECKIEDKEAGKGAENMEETTQLREVKDSSTPTDVGSKEGRILSDADAAVLIQAAYRGYQVRKWEPLKKLKQIDEVRKEVTNVQDRVQAFERSSDLQNDEKQKIAIGENIMRLLLKLDTIQGLHPSFREIRKSLARELTILQERLDSLMANKPQQQMQDIQLQKDVEVTPTNMQNEEHLPGDSSEANSDGGNVSQSPVDPVPNEGTESVILPNGSGSEDTIQVVTADTLNSTSDVSETAKMAVEPEDKAESKDIPIEVDELDMTIEKELPMGVLDEDSNDASIEKEEHDNSGSGSVSAMVNDSAGDGLDSENHAMMEHPVGLLDEDERDSEMNISREETNEEFIEELPVGILDEKEEESEIEKHDEAKPKEVLLAQEGECNAEEKTSSSTDETSKETQSEQQQQPLEDQKDEIELPPLTTNVNDHEQGNEDVNNISAEPMESVPMNDTQKEEEPEGKIAVKETQKDGEVIVCEALAEEKTEPSAASSASQADHDGGLKGEWKLVEENEKLREMMKKLLEAGNEQLNVISDLTGRVKELEKRLAKSRSKRMKTKKRYRQASSKISGMNP